MGGYGSGRKSDTNCTNDYRSIDIRRWQRGELLVTGLSFQCQWSYRGKANGKIHVKTEHYQQFIADSIKDLPLDALEEIADFVTFLQQKIKKKYTLQQSDNALLMAELHLLSHHEQQHLEQEFIGYEQQFPRE